MPSLTSSEARNFKNKDLSGFAIRDDSLLRPEGGKRAQRDSECPPQGGIEQNPWRIRDDNYPYSETRHDPLIYLAIQGSLCHISEVIQTGNNL